MSLTTARAGTLFDFAVSRPEPFEAREACKKNEWSLAQFRKAARSLRQILQDDNINLICTSQGFGQPNLYALVGNLEKAGPWVATRLRSLESQLETVYAVSSSLQNGTDGRTTQGRKARLIYRHVGRLIEDLGELEGKLPLR